MWRQSTWRLVDTHAASAWSFAQLQVDWEITQLNTTSDLIQLLPVWECCSVLLILCVMCSTHCVPYANVQAYMLMHLTDPKYYCRPRLSEDWGGCWTCRECVYTSKKKSNALSHVESVHLVTAGYNCQVCRKFCPTATSLRNHNARYHKWFFLCRVWRDFEI